MVGFLLDSCIFSTGYSAFLPSVLAHWRSKVVGMGGGVAVKRLREFLLVMLVVVVI